MPLRYRPSSRSGIGKRSLVVALVALLLVVALLVAIELEASSTGNPFVSYSTQSYAGIQECSGALQHPVNAPGNVTILSVPMGQTLDICVEYYFYSGPNATVPASLDLSKQVSITSLYGNALHDASSNFTVSIVSSGNNVTNPIEIGGPNNLHEGYPVEFKITPKTAPGLAYGGTYNLKFGADTTEQPPQGQFPILSESCISDFHLQFGNGLPDYSEAGGCIGNRLSHPGDVPLPIPNKILIAILGVTYSSP